MTISLGANSRKLAFAGASLLFVALASGLSLRIFLAETASQSEQPAAWLRAVRLVPENAAYHNQLGNYELLLNNAGLAIHEQQTAVRLNPFMASYWFDLARAEQVTGRVDEQERALVNATLAEPTAPEVAWEAGNFFQARGEQQKALAQFRHVMESDPTMTPDALAMAWRIQPDAPKLLAEAIPPKADVQLDFLWLLVARNEVDASLKVWASIAALRQPVNPERGASYVDYLLAQQRPDAALAVWQQLAPVAGLTPYLPNDNLIVNGRFELAPLNRGLDWHYISNQNVRLVLDATEFQEGTKSLVIEFTGGGVNEAGIYQFIPAKPETSYEFTGHFKSDELDGAGGLRFSLQDAYTNAVLYQSDDLRSPGSWRTAGGIFQTGASTRLLALRIVRVPPGNAIHGRLWIDNLQLIARPDQSTTP